MGILDGLKRKKPGEVSSTSKPSAAPKNDEALSASESPVKPTSPLRWQVGETIYGRYQISRVLGGPGESSTGIVYICYDHKTKEPLALKTIQNKFLRNQSVLDGFKRGAQVWAELGDHYNIVKAKGVEEINGKPYILMEYVVSNQQYGATLAGWIRRGGLTIPLTVDLAIQFCHGMVHANKKSDGQGKHLVHLGITPQNILVTWDSVVKITDFSMVQAFAGFDEDIPLTVLGDASDSRPSLAKSGNIYGTPPYMSPEQCRGESEIDTRSDIYAFGCVLYEMLVRRQVFQGRTLEEYVHEHLNAVPQSPLVHNKLDEIVLKCLEKDADKRYHDFEELEEVLSQVYSKLTGESIKRLETGELRARELANKGVSLSRLGRSKEAIEYYMQALKVNPDYVAVHSLLGSIYLAEGSRDKAIAELKEVLKVDPEFIEAHVKLGDIYKDGNYPDEAIKEYREALRINPNDATTRCNLSDVLKIVSKPDEAIAELKEALQVDPTYAEAHNKLGIIFKSQGKIDEAIREWKEALSSRLSDAELRYNLGLAYKEQDKLDDAIREWREAMMLKPEYVEANLNLANAYVDKKEFDKAIELYNKVLTSNDKDVRARHNLGVAFKEKGETDKAIEEWEKILGIGGNDAEVHYNIGVVRCDQGKLDEAISKYQEALKVNPKYVNARYNLGLAFANQGKLANAIREFKEVLTIDPKLTQAHYNLATAYKAQGMYQEALQQYEAFVESASPEQSSLVAKAEETINRLKQRVKKP